MLRATALLLITLLCYSCIQQKSVKGQYKKTSSDQIPDSSTGLKIQSTPTRGTLLSDSIGSEYFIVHVTNTITNHHKIPIQLEIDFPSELSYPISNSQLNFRIVLWPELTEPPNLYFDRQDRVQVMENWTISDWEGSNQFDKTLAPGESYTVTIGTLVDTQVPNICSAVAYKFLTYAERSNYSDCEWTLNEEGITDPQLALGLQVGFCTSGLHYERCTIINCGRISHVEEE